MDNNTDKNISNKSDDCKDWFEKVSKRYRLCQIEVAASVNRKGKVSL